MNEIYRTQTSLFIHLTNVYCGVYHRHKQFTPLCSVCSQGTHSLLWESFKARVKIQRDKCYGLGKRRCFPPYSQGHVIDLWYQKYKQVNDTPQELYKETYCGIFRNVLIFKNFTEEYGNIYPCKSLLSSLPNSLLLKKALFLFKIIHHLCHFSSFLNVFSISCQS